MLFKDYIYIQENYRKGISEKQDSGWQLSLCGGEGAKQEGLWV